MGKVGFGKKIKKNMIYIFIAIILLMLLLIVAVYAFDRIYNPVTTELALNYEVEDTITVDGLVFRNEKVVTYDKSGELDYLVDDGQRVSLGETVAKAYSSENGVYAEREIRELTKQADELENIASSGDVYVLGVDTIVRQVSEDLCKIAACNGNMGLGDMSETVATLSGNITKKQVATGTQVDFSKRIEEINNRIEELKDSIENSPESIKADSAGYFYRQCDGYEGLVDTKNITSMTIAQFESVKPNEIPQDAIGKITDSYAWYYVFKADKETARHFKQEETLQARFSLVSSEKFKVTVEAVNFEGDTALIILKSDFATGQITGGKDQPLEIILKTYEGLRVDDRAIRVVDEKTGVYVQMGYEVKFRTIDIAYQTEEFAIVPASDKDGQLKLYDSVIVKGEDLYDGKLLS